MTVIATDNFTGTNGDNLPTYSGNWTAVKGTLEIQSNAFACTTSGTHACAAWNADTFEDDQYAEATIIALSASTLWLGVTVRCSLSVTTFYLFDGSGTDGFFYLKYVTGTATTLANDTANTADGDILRLEVTGTTLDGQDNGVTQIGTQTDSAITSGYAGVGGYNSSTTHLADDFEGGNLSGITHKVRTTANDGTASSLTWSHVTSGSDKLLVVGAGTSSTSVTVSSVTHNGNSLTLLKSVGSSSAGSKAELWYMVAPDTTGNIVVTYSGSASVAAIGNSYTGVHQNNVFSVVHGKNNAAALTSIDIGSATDELAIDVTMSRSAETATPDSGQLSRGTVNVSLVRMSMSEEAGTAVNTLGWAWSTEKAYAQVAVAIRPAGSTAAKVQLEQELLISNNSAVTTSVLTFDATASVNNLLVTAIAIDKDGGTPTITQSGWSTPVIIKANTSSTLVYTYKVSDGTETAVTWNFDSHTYAAWFGEYSGVSAASAFDVSASANSGASAVTSQSTGTTGTTGQANSFALALFASDTGTNVDVGRALTNNFTEGVFENTSTSPAILVADKILTSTGTVETTFSNTDTGDQQCGAMLVFNIVPAPKITDATVTAMNGDGSFSIPISAQQSGRILVLANLTKDNSTTADTLTALTFDSAGANATLSGGEIVEQGSTQLAQEGDFSSQCGIYFIKDADLPSTAGSYLFAPVWTGGRQHTQWVCFEILDCPDEAYDVLVQNFSLSNVGAGNTMSDSITPSVDDCLVVDFWATSHSSIPTFTSTEIQVAQVAAGAAGGVVSQFTQATAASKTMTEETSTLSQRRAWSLISFSGVLTSVGGATGKSNPLSGPFGGCLSGIM